LGGASRQVGVSLFETMIEIDAYGARETLTEIDGRFAQHQSPTQSQTLRQLTRRRRHRRARRKAN
jgi:hypothetical protein